jgi:hypothetical protein
MSDYIPASDAGFINWSANFETLIAANPTNYGLVAADATAITAADTTWQAAYTLATDPSTRTPATVADKDVQRANAEAVMRPYAMQVNANPAVTDQQRVDLGLTVRATSPTPASQPTDVPLPSLRSQQQAAMVFDVRATATPTSRARPAGTDGLQAVMEKESSYGAGDWTFQEVAQFLDNPAQWDAPAGTTGESWRMRCRWFNKAKANGVSLTGPWSAYVPFISTAP